MGEIGFGESDREGSNLDASSMRQPLPINTIS
jgi:hypothetical protein